MSQSKQDSDSRGFPSPWGELIPRASSLFCEGRLLLGCRWQNGWWDDFLNDAFLACCMWVPSFKHENDERTLKHDEFDSMAYRCTHRDVLNSGGARWERCQQSRVAVPQISKPPSKAVWGVQSISHEQSELSKTELLCPMFFSLLDGWLSWNSLQRSTCTPAPVRVVKKMWTHTITTDLNSQAASRPSATQGDDSFWIIGSGAVNLKLQQTSDTSSTDCAVWDFCESNSNSPTPNLEANPSHC